MNVITLRRLGMLIAVVFVTNSGNCEAAIYRNVSDLNQSDEFGQSAVFDPVGLLVGTDAAGDSFVAGSGILIDPNWVLFAGHSASNGEGTTWESLRFSTSPDTLNNLNSFTDVDLFLTHEDYVPGTPGGQGNDIALARLINPITDVIPANRFYGQDVIGAELVMAGYGNPGVWPNVGEFDGIRRGGRNIVDSFGGTIGNAVVDEKYFVTDFDRSNGNDPLALEKQGSRHDSGGGAFRFVDDEFVLAGFTVGGLTSNTNTFIGRVTEFNPWIDNTMAANAVPEPSAIALLAVATVGVVLRRRRKVAR